MPTSRATRVTSAANERSCSTIVLSVSLSSRISPRTSTVIFFDRSPPAIAVATSAMLRTWAVRFDAMKLTLSVRSFQVPATPGTCAWPPSLPSVPTSRATRVTSDGERVELVHHRVDGVLELQDFALHVDGDLARQVAARDRRGHLGDVAHLAGEVAGHRVDAVGQVFPGAGDAGHVRLAAEPAFGADFARDARHLAGEAVELVDHRVEGFLELKDFAAHIDRDLARQIAAGDRGRDLGDVADLRGEVAGHRVDAVGQVFPGAGDAGHLGLAAELAVGADFAGDAGHLGGEGVELVDHRVDGLFELQDFAADTFTVIFFDRSPCATAVATSAMLRTWAVRLLAIELTLSVRSFQVPATPRTTAWPPSLPSVPTSRATRVTSDGERVELVDGRVDGLLELKDLALDVDRDLLRQVAVRDRGRHLGDVADLGGQVARHRVDAVGQVLPGAGDAGHVGLTAEPPLGADLARDARHLAGEHVELVDHGVHGLLELQDFAADVHRDLLGKVAARDGRRDLGDIADLRGQVATP